MRFRNPQTGYVEDFGDVAWLWVLGLGPFYFAYKRMWVYAGIAAACALVTGPVAWVFVFPFLANWLIRSYYTKQGWTEITDGMVINSTAGERNIDVKLLTTPPEGDYRVLSEVAVKLVRRSPLQRKFTVADVNYRLQEKALALGANAVANVVYTEDDGSKLLASHAGYIEAKGLAIIDESDTVACPFCAEKIKRVAKKCKHCGSEIPATPA